MRVIRGWLWALLIGLTGCASEPKQFVVHNINQSQVWPERSDVARYRYIGELHGESIQREKLYQSWISKVIGLIQGQGEIQTLKRPYSGFTDQDGKVYVADLGASAVFVFDVQNKTLNIWKQAAKSQPFVAPVAVVKGAEEDIWVLDAELASVFRLNNMGEPQGVVAKGLLKRPVGLAYHAETKKLFVTDSHSHEIKVFDSQGSLIDVIGKRGEGLGELNFPTSLVIKGDRLLVTDSLNARVQVMSLDGVVEQVIGKRGLNIGNTPRPKGVAVDSSDNIYIVESYFGYLLVFDQYGQFLLPISGKDRELGEFFLPAGVWVDQQDRIYLADMFKGRIVILQYLGADY